VGGLGRYLVSFFIGVIVSKFRVKKLVLDMFPLFSTFRLILVGIGRGVGRGVGIADSGL
jgi:hypothetical protein